MLAQETIARIRHLFHAEHWKIGTIADHLGLHHNTVRQALETERFNCKKTPRTSLTDPFIDFIRQTLKDHPRLRATRLYEMIRQRGYKGSVVQLRRVVSEVRPRFREAFMDLRFFPAEQAQVDWAHFGKVTIGRATRKLSCFVMILCYSRALYLEFFFDQSLESFLRGHVRAFRDFSGLPRVLLYDNLRSVVLERRKDLIHFHPRLLELSAHYHFQPRACRPMRGSEKGRVERTIRYIRDSFFAARYFTNLEVLNRQALKWRDEIALLRPWPDDRTRKVKELYEEEKLRLLPLPAHPINTDLLKPVVSRKRIYVRYDLNDYSIPPKSVGQTLTLAASDTRVRLLDGSKVLVTHERSYDRGQRIEDPAHIQELVEQKTRALGSTRHSRLIKAVPESEEFLDQAFRRGESPAKVAADLLRLLDDYGEKELRAGILKALERDTPRSSSVAYLLRKRHTAARRRPPYPVELHRRPELSELHVQPHLSETYDGLTNKKTDE